MTTRTTILNAANDDHVKYSTLATVLPDRVRHHPLDSVLPQSSLAGAWRTVLGSHLAAALILAALHRRDRGVRRQHRRARR